MAAMGEVGVVGQAVRVHWRQPRPQLPAVEGVLVAADATSGLLVVVRGTRWGAQTRMLTPASRCGTPHAGSCRPMRWRSLKVRARRCAWRLCTL
jgi:hypothetical protein